MEVLLISVIIILSLLLAVFLFVFYRKLDTSRGSEKIDGLTERLIQQSEKLSQLSQENRDLRGELDRKLSETYRSNQEQFGHNAKIIRDISSQSAKLIEEVTEKLTKLDETNRQVVNFSAQLQSLQDILKNPKQRGILGEYYLEETLKNVLPPNSYQMQYPFKDGVIVDAVVFVKDKIIPIDSKIGRASCRERV